MSLSTANVGRDPYWGPGVILWTAVRILLVIGLLHFVAFGLFGGHFFFGPGLLMPLFFVWIFAGGPMRGGYRRRMRDREYRNELPAPAPPAARDERLEAELTSARRQIRELEAKVSWQERLLEVPKTPAAAPAPVTPPEVTAARVALEAPPAPAAPLPPAPAPRQAAAFED
jgi:hypothetical protein